MNEYGTIQPYRAWWRLEQGEIPRSRFSQHSRSELSPWWSARPQIAVPAPAPRQNPLRSIAPIRRHTEAFHEKKYKKSRHMPFQTALLRTQVCSRPHCTGISTNTYSIQRGRTAGIDKMQRGETKGKENPPVRKRWAARAASACGGGGGAQRGAICRGHRIHPNGGWGEVAGRAWFGIGASYRGGSWGAS
jgi:hypothetical protein